MKTTFAGNSEAAELWMNFLPQALYENQRATSQLFHTTMTTTVTLLVERCTEFQSTPLVVTTRSCHSLLLTIAVRESLALLQCTFLDDQRRHSALVGGDTASNGTQSGGRGLTGSSTYDSLAKVKESVKMAESSSKAKSSTMDPYQVKIYHSPISQGTALLNLKFWDHPQAHSRLLFILKSYNNIM